MDTLITQYEPLIRSMASKFYGIDKEDLIQAGFLGLSKAYKNYDDKLGCKFSTYAYHYIYGEMYETVNGNKPIKLRKDIIHIYKSVLKTREILSQKYGKEVDYDTVCKYLNIDFNLFLDILNSISATVDIDYVELKSKDKSNLDDLIMLRDSLESLNDMERNVIKSRYMSDLSQDETAKVLGISQVSVSRIEKSAKEKIKKYVAS